MTKDSQPSTSTESIKCSDCWYEYQADSPDEKALVEAASRYQICLVESEERHAIVRVRGQLLRYERFNQIDFDSIRKRMSVMVRDPLGRVQVICKGAESELINLVENGQIARTYTQLEGFAQLGLRTLIIARKFISEQEQETIQRQLEQAYSSLIAQQALVNPFINFDR